MRAISPRYRALIGHPNRWETVVEWSNDGGRNWRPATYLPGGKVTCSATSQVRWTTELTIADAPFGLDGINAYNTQLRILHGIAGLPMLPMGVYKVTSASVSSDSRYAVKLRGSSRECYLIGARFTTSRSFPSQGASRLATTLIREVIPDAVIAWQVEDTQLPKIVEPRDRWPLIDGDRDATSIARALGARIYAGPSGEFIAAPTPTLDDPTVWEAREGANGVLLSHAEELSDDGVFNIMVVGGQSTSGDVPPFKPGIAQDLDPMSPTYVGRPVTEGGFGPRPRFYTSQLITSSAKAQTAARAMLAPYLGLRQQVTFTQVHDPSLEPGDVGIVHTTLGPRRVILDALDYSLDGAPMTGQTRTTATRLDGVTVDAPEEGGE